MTYMPTRYSHASAGKAREPHAGEITALVQELKRRKLALETKKPLLRWLDLRPNEEQDFTIVHSRSELRGQGRATVKVIPPTPLHKFRCDVYYHEFNLNGAQARYRMLTHAKPSDVIALGIPGVIDTLAGIVKGDFLVKFQCKSERAGRFRFEILPH